MKTIFALSAVLLPLSAPAMSQNDTGMAHFLEVAMAILGVA